MSSWKALERSVASLFGTTRRPLSGSNQGTGFTDDCQHPTLYIEAKYRKKHSIWELWRQVKSSATIEGRGRVPVVAVKERGKTGTMICVNSQDLTTLAVEYLKANPEELEKHFNEKS
jgi:hypothetical protein